MKDNLEKLTRTDCFNRLGEVSLKELYILEKIKDGRIPCEELDGRYGFVLATNAQLEIHKQNYKDGKDFDPSEEIKKCMYGRAHNALSELRIAKSLNKLKEVKGFMGKYNIEYNPDFENSITNNYLKHDVKSLKSMIELAEMEDD